MYTETERKVIRMAGTLICAVAVGKVVELWFASPSGDSSDSCVFRMECLTETQAAAIAKTHEKRWGIA